MGRLFFVVRLELPWAGAAFELWAGWAWRFVLKGGFAVVAMRLLSGCAQGLGRCEGKCLLSSGTSFMACDLIGILAALSRSAGPGEVGRHYTKEELMRAVEMAVEKSASDLHLRAGGIPLLRWGQELEPLPGFTEPVSSQSIESLVAYFAEAARKTNGPAARAESQSHLSADFALDIGRAVIRVHLMKQMEGCSLVVRFFYREHVSLPFLGLQLVPKLLGSPLPTGLVIFSGPPNSGKTTAAAATVEWLNQTRHLHVVGLEDPTEFVFKEVNCRISQRTVGVHVPDFQTGFRDALREDANVMFVGEVRDASVMWSVLQAAETGLLVVTTMHAASVVDCLNRIINLVGGEYQDNVRAVLSSCPVVIVNQRLLPSVRKRLVLCYEVLSSNDSISSLLKSGDFRGVTDHMWMAQDRMVPWDKRLVELATDVVDPIPRELLRAYTRDAVNVGRLLSKAVPVRETVRKL